MATFASQLSAAQRQYESLSPDEPADGLIENGDAGEYIREQRADAFLDEALSLIEDWITGPQDKFAEAKLLRTTKALAEWVAEECSAEDERRRAWRPD